ncbi:MAG TPA: PIG-L family deacetylase, partial [Mycobacterium sp.]|nr:PIG-L family deacetylase [Mycobacterium sp.]
MRTIPIGNCTRFAAKPLTRGGTPVPVWLAALDREALPSLDLTGCRSLVVVAPHPDDETLGLGATIAQLVSS